MHMYRALSLILTLSMILITSSTSLAQGYMTAGGLRMGTDWGLTAKQRLAKSTTGELIFQSSLQREELLLTALVAQHYPLVFRGINVYVGGGLHKGWYNPTPPSHTENPAADPGNPFGFSFIGGAELTLGKINISYDFKPAFNITGGEHRFYAQTGVSVRYVFVTNKEYKKKQRQKRREQRRREGKGIHLGDDWMFWKKKN